MAATIFTAEADKFTCQMPQNKDEHNPHTGRAKKICLVCVQKIHYTLIINEKAAPRFIFASTKFFSGRFRHADGITGIEWEVTGEECPKTGSGKPQGIFDW